MLKRLKEFLHLESRPVKKNVEVNIGVSNNKIVFEFEKPIRNVEFDKIQAMDLIVVLTQKIPLLKKP